MASRDLPSMSPSGPNSLFSDEPLLSPEASLAYTRAQAEAQAGHLRDQAIATGQFTAAMRQAIGDLSGLARDVSAARQGFAEGGTGDTASGRFRRATTSDLSSLEGDAPPIRQRFAEARQQGYSNSMSGITRRVAGVAAQAMSSRVRVWDDNPTQQPDGSLAFHERDSNGNITNTVPVNGSGPGAFDQAASDIAAQDRGNNRWTYGAAIASRVAQGQGLGGALGVGAARLAGGVGLAVGAVQKGFDVYNDQTQKGAEFRQIYGEDAGRFAISERFGRFTSGWGSYFSGLGRERGEEAYMAALRMGLTGTRLEGAQNFAGDMYRTHGMDTQTSMQFVGMSSENAQISLAALSEQIEKVGSAAVAAGKNSEEAIQAFANTTQQLRSSVSDTGSAPAVAGALSAQMSYELPKNLATDQNLAAMAGTLTQSNMMMYAQSTGQDARTVMNAIATGSEDVSLQVISGTALQAANAICTAGGLTLEEMRSYLKQTFPGVKTLSREQQMQALAAFPGINPLTIGSIFSTFGINIPAGQQVQYFFEIVTGSFDDLGAEKDVAWEQMSRLMGWGSADYSKGGFKVEGEDPKNTLLRGWEVAREATGLTNAPVGTMAAAGAYESSEAYAMSLAETGTRSKAAEGLLGLSEEELKNSLGVNTLDEVRLTDNQGKSVSIADVISNEGLRQQLDAGTLNFQGAGGSSLPLSDLINIDNEALATSSGSVADPGGYLLSLTPEARRYFGLTGPSDAQRAGVPAMGSLVPSRYGVGN